MYLEKHTTQFHSSSYIQTQPWPVANALFKTVLHGWSAALPGSLLGGAGGWDNGPGGPWLWEGRGQENTSSCRDIIFIIRCPSEVLEKHVLSAQAIIHLGSCSKRHGGKERESERNRGISTDTLQQYREKRRARQWGTETNRHLEIKKCWPAVRMITECLPFSVKLLSAANHN